MASGMVAMRKLRWTSLYRVALAQLTVQLLHHTMARGDDSRLLCLCDVGKPKVAQTVGPCVAQYINIVLENGKAQRVSDAMFTGMGKIDVQNVQHIPYVFGRAQKHQLHSCGEQQLLNALLGHWVSTFMSASHWMVRPTPTPWTRRSGELLSLLFGLGSQASIFY